MTDTSGLPAVGDGLVFVDGGYEQVGDRVFRWRGSRPGAGWHAHGWTRKRLLTWRRGRLVRIVVFKRRWKHSDLLVTCHSRPPDDVPGVAGCTLVLTLALWSWLTSPSGLVRTACPLLGRLASRSVQRWMAQAQRLAAHTEQALRAICLEFDQSEPRPAMRPYASGLSPPAKRWRAPAAAGQLHRALAYLFRQGLHTTGARLLAGARGRWTGPDQTFIA